MRSARILGKRRILTEAPFSAWSRVLHVPGLSRFLTTEGPATPRVGRRAGPERHKSQWRSVPRQDVGRQRRFLGSIFTLSQITSFMLATSARLLTKRQHSPFPTIHASSSTVGRCDQPALTPTTSATICQHTTLRLPKIPWMLTQARREEGRYLEAGRGVEGGGGGGNDPIPYCLPPFHSRHRRSNDTGSCLPLERKKSSPQRPFGLFLGPPFHLRYCVPPRALDSPPTLWCHRRAHDAPPPTRRLSFSAIFNYPSYPARQTSRQGTKNDRRQDLDHDTRDSPSSPLQPWIDSPPPHAECLASRASEVPRRNPLPSPPRGLTANRRQTESLLSTIQTLVIPLPKLY